MMEGLASSIWQAYENDEFTDLRVNCSGVIFNIHKVVLCSRSKVFKAMCQSSFKEASENEILIDDELEVFRSVISWIYKSSYTYEPFHEQPDEIHPGKPLCHHAKVFAFADKYDMKELATAAVKNYTEFLPMQLLEQILDLATHNLPAIIQNDLFPSISLVYNTTAPSNRELRDEVVTYLRRYGLHLKRPQQSSLALSNIPEAFMQLLAEEPQVSLDLLDNFLTYPYFKCKKCNEKADSSAYNYMCSRCRVKASKQAASSKNHYILG